MDSILYAGGSPAAADAGVSRPVAQVAAAMAASETTRLIRDFMGDVVPRVPHQPADDSPRDRLNEWPATPGEPAPAFARDAADAQDGLCASTHGGRSASTRASIYLASPSHARPLLRQPSPASHAILCPPSER